MASKSYMHGRGEVLPPFHAQMFAYLEYNLHKMKSSQRIFNWKFYFRSIFSLGIEKLNHTVCPCGVDTTHGQVTEIHRE